MIDLTPEALQNRMSVATFTAAKKWNKRLRNFFRRGNLIALRELALRQVAEQVDRSLESYMVEKDIRESWAVRERIACVHQRQSESASIWWRGQRAWRVGWMRNSTPSMLTNRQWTNRARKPSLQTCNLRKAWAPSRCAWKGENIADARRNSCETNT